MKDRIVEHPNRYRLVQVAGETDTYDLVAVPGRVTEAGTPISKETLLSDIVENLYDSGTPSQAFEAIATQIAAMRAERLLAKNSIEDCVSALGYFSQEHSRYSTMALEIYAISKGETGPFPHLKQLPGLFSSTKTAEAVNEVINSPSLSKLLNDDLGTYMNAFVSRKTLYAHGSFYNESPFQFFKISGLGTFVQQKLNDSFSLGVSTNTDSRYVERSTYNSNPIDVSGYSKVKVFAVGKFADSMGFSDGVRMCRIGVKHEDSTVNTIDYPVGGSVFDVGADQTIKLYAEMSCANNPKYATSLSTTIQIYGVSLL